jgi:hypothetical protein
MRSWNACLWIKLMRSKSARFVPLPRLCGVLWHIGDMAGQTVVAPPVPLAVYCALC